MGCGCKQARLQAAADAKAAQAAAEQAEREAALLAAAKS
jgi:hypothetical protein